MTETQPQSNSVRTAAVLALVLRVVYSAVAAIFNLFLPVQQHLIHSNALTASLPRPNHSFSYAFWGIWERFDTLWYLHIARFGYDRPDAIVFYPLYPTLIKVASHAMRPVAAALLISTVASFFLFWGLLELLSLDLPPRLAWRSVLLCALWPASLIFFAGYTESLLLALMIWALYMARRNRWLLAGVLGAAAGTAKAAGILVLVPLLVMVLRKRSVKGLTVLLVPAGPAGFLLWLGWAARGSVVAAYRDYWHTTPAYPWVTLSVALHALAHSPNPILLMNLLFLAIFCWLVAMSRMKPEYSFYAVAAILFLLSKQTTPPLQSMVRYLLIVFPAYVGAARWFEKPRLTKKFGMACAALFVVNLGLMWLFLGWSLVL